MAPNHNDINLVEMIQRVLANHGVTIIKNQKESEERINFQLTSRFRELTVNIKFLVGLIILLTLYFTALGLRMFYDNEEKQEKSEQKIELQIKTLNKQNQEIKQQQMLLKTELVTLRNQIKNGK